MSPGRITLIAAALGVALFLPGCETSEPPPVIVAKPPPLLEQMPTPCTSRQAMTGQLSDGYMEEATGRGVTPGGAVFEMWQTPGGETWTAILNLANGATCLVAAGESWQAIEARPTGLPL